MFVDSAGIGALQRDDCGSEVTSALPGEPGHANPAHPPSIGANEYFEAKRRSASVVTE